MEFSSDLIILVFKMIKINIVIVLFFKMFGEFYSQNGIYFVYFNIIFLIDGIMGKIQFYFEGY